MLRSILGAAIAAIVVTTAARATGLTEGDFEYLGTQNIERASPLIRDLSPKENATLHALINDVRTKDSPASRAALGAALDVHREHQLWEKTNPGKLWDAPAHR